MSGHLTVRIFLCVYAKDEVSERYLHTRTSFPLNFFELIPRFSSPPLLAPVFILRDPEPHFDVSDVMETFPPHVN